MPKSNRERSSSVTWPLTASLALIWLGAAVLFVWLAHHAATEPISNFDFNLSVKINAHAGFLNPILRVDNRLGTAGPYGLLMFAIVAVLLLLRCRLEAVFILSVLVPALVVAVIKRIVQEPPPMTTQAIAVARQHFSFPSGHVTGLTALLVLVIVFAPRMVPSAPLVALLRAGCFIVIATVGVARVWAFAHWPNDVAGGYLLATLFLIPALALYVRLRARLDAQGMPEDVPSQSQPARLK